MQRLYMFKIAQKVSENGHFFYFNKTQVFNYQLINFLVLFLE